MRPLQVVAAIAGLATLSCAWPGSDLFEGGAERAVHGLEAVERVFRRQNDAASTSATTGKTTATGKTSATSKTTETGSKSAKATGSQKGTGTITGSAKGTGSGNGNGNGTAAESAAATTQYDARLPAGGVSMITPNVFAGAQYYRVGDYVTFAWNFTGILATPSAVNVLASCSENSVEYTLLANASYDQRMTYVWDTNEVAAKATAPQLIMGKYTLIIENADQARATGGAQPGYLGSLSQLTFGMYTPQPYTPWSEFNCPTCKSGFSKTEQQTIQFLLGMGCITILSFTWFATGRFAVI